MKALYLLPFSVFAFLNAKAQYDPEMNREEKQVYENQIQQSHDHWKNSNISSNTVYRVKNGDSVKLWHYEFDKEGRTVQSIRYRKNGKEKERWDFTWDDQDRMTSNHKTRNGKDLSGAAWTYSGTNPDPVEILWKGKKGETETRVVHKYDAQQNLVEAETYHGKNLSKKGWRFEYEYYENGSAKESRYYNPKGKLKQVYTYDCNQMPKTDKQIQKDTTKACIKYEADTEGNKTKIIEMQDDKGRLMVTRVVYDKNNHITSTVKTNWKGKVIESYAAVVNESGLVLSSKRQYKKGLRKIRVSYVSTFDTEGNLIRTAAIKNDKPLEYVNTYSKF